MSQTGRRLRRLTAALALGAMVVATPAGAADKPEHVLKFAGLAPEGTSYMQITHAWMDAVRERSDGRLRILFYPGGVMGDEPDLVRKIRLGQLHGAGITGLGMASAVPAVRVLEQPFLFRNLDEVDAVREKISPVLEDVFRQSGYELLSWAEVGFVYLYSAYPLQQWEDARRRRMWIWQADPIAVAIGRALPEVVSVPLSVPELIAAASAGNIDMLYSSPLALVAAGLQTRMTHIVDLPLVYATGAVVVSRRAFEALPADLQTILRDSAAEILTGIIPETRRQNAEAQEILIELGQKVIEPEPVLQQAIEERLLPLRQQFVGTLYEADLLAQVEAAIAAVRAGAKTADAP